MTSVIVGQVKDENLFDVVFKDTSTGQEYSADFWTVTQYIVVRNIYLSMLNIFAAIMDLVLIGFFCYHLYLVSIGQTTNESFKWAYMKQVQTKLVVAHKKFLKQEKREEICDPANETTLMDVADIDGSSKTIEAGDRQRNLVTKRVHTAVDATTGSDGATIIENVQKDVNDSDGSDDTMGDGYVCVESLSVSKVGDEPIKSSSAEAVSALNFPNNKSSANDASDLAAYGAKGSSAIVSTGLFEEKVTHLLSAPIRHPIRTFIDGTYRLPDILEVAPVPLPANIYHKGIFQGLR